MTSPRDRRVHLEVEGHVVPVTSLDRIYWPSIGFSKRDAIGYFAAVARVLLPLIRDRPLALKRAPEGVTGSWWYQTECPHPPPWVRTIAVPAADGDSVWHQCSADNVATLVWFAQIGCLELHPLLFREQDPGSAIEVVFDLDPGPPADLIKCCEVALQLREVLDAAGLTSFVKTSGGAGIHLHVPVSPPPPIATARNFSQAVATLVADSSPEVVLEKGPATRKGKVLVDWQQNGSYRSLPAPYSLRLTQLPLVAMPLEWPEVEAATRHRDVHRLMFLPQEAIERVEAGVNPMADMRATEQSLPS